MEETDEFCSSVLSQFSTPSSSTNEHHLHICAAIGTISRTLKDQSVPLSPLAYFCATSASLRKSLSAPRPPSHLIDAYSAILALVFDTLPGAVLRRQFDDVEGILIGAVNCGAIGGEGLVWALKCVGRLVCVREEVEWGM